MGTLIFLRHPVTSAGEGVCYGQLDLGLGDEAEAQIEMALAQTPRPAEIQSSDLFRARTLAERIAARDDMRITFDERLREYNFGDWEGRLWSEIPETEWRPWYNDLWGVSPPGGESFASLHNRVADALADFGDETLVVAHAGVIRAAMMLFHGQTFDEVFATKIPFCEPIVLERQMA